MTNTALSAKIEQVQFAEQIAQNVTLNCTLNCNLKKLTQKANKLLKRIIKCENSQLIMKNVLRMQRRCDTIEKICSIYGGAHEN